MKIHDASNINNDSSDRLMVLILMRIDGDGNSSKDNCSFENMVIIINGKWW